MPTGEKTMEIKLLKVGYCTHCERVARRSGSFANIQFPMIVGLIKHDEHGLILFDTGYSEHFFECTKRYPNKLYKDLTPVTLDDDLKIENILKEEGISVDEIDHIIISHFHADHIAGLKNFRNANFICKKSAWMHFQKSEGLLALKNGYLKGLIPDDFEHRVKFIEDEYEINEMHSPLFSAHNLFNDENLVLIDLPGHAVGQIGLLVENERVFFIADACWFKSTYINLDFPSSITGLIFHDSKKYKDTVKKIQQFNTNNPEVFIVPSHCEESYLSYKANQNIQP